MIKADITDRKTEIDINGDMATVLREYTAIAHQLRGLLAQAKGEAFADRTIRFCNALSKKNEEQLEKEIDREIEEAEG